MTVKINADTSSGLKFVSDTSGAIDFQSNGVTKMSMDASGNLTANSFIGTGAALVKLAGETLTSDVSSVTFSTSVITTTYKTYILYTRLQPKTDGARVILRMNDDSGTLLNSVSDYQSQVYRGGGTDFSDTTVSSIYPVSTAGNASGEYAFYRHEFSEPRTSDKKTTFLIHGVNATTDGNIATVQGAGLLTVAEDNQGMTLLFDSGDIASGSSYVLFGVKE
tara:strand:+ start:145 stop:807 length:663 start_codon:yes stop_codon:yes gene_type:complete